MISKLKTDKSTNLTQVVEKVNQIARKLNTLVALREIETEERLAKKGIIKCVADKPPTDKHDEWKCEVCEKLDLRYLIVPIVNPHYNHHGMS